MSRSSSDLRRGLYVAALALASGVGLCSLSTLGGCATQNCDTSPEGNPAADFHGGILHAEEKVYETSRPDGLHLNFGAGARYRIYHQLGGRPAVIQLWVSFSSLGVNGGNEAIPAGNMAEVTNATAEFVEVRNDSCGDYWLRVVLSDPVGDGVEQLPPGSGAAGAGGGGGLARQGFFAPARVDAARSSR